MSYFEFWLLVMICVSVVKPAMEYMKAAQQIWGPIIL